MPHPEETEKMRKTAGVLLIVLSLTGLFFGYFYVRRNINLATVGYKPNKNQNQELEDSVFALKSKDTDKDGISDYDEIYLYKTSPYLEDTDSDGISDKEEISAGENPNCPKGENCLQQNPLSSPFSETQPIKPNLPPAPSEELTKNPLENLSMENLREILKNAGVTEETLGKISDDELQKMVEETIKNMQSSQ